MLQAENVNLIEYETCPNALPLKLKCCLNLILIKTEQILSRHGRSKKGNGKNPE